MEASEMLDVIHVLFEDDTLPTWEQDQEIKDKLRQAIYRDMYGHEYGYGSGSDYGRSADWEFGGTPTEAPEPTGIYAEPKKGVIKPYIPPTNERELFDIVGPPMGEG